MSVTIQNYSLSTDKEKVKLLKDTFCKGATDQEFQLFVHACERTQLDPFMRQIHAVKRYDSKLQREVMTIQTGIDGYRLIAERTEKYSPGSKPTYDYDTQGNLFSATAYVKKLTKDGTWHVVEAEAFFDEYCQTYVDKRTGEKKKVGMWNNMQRNQLAKCAEALALRKAFPAELSGIYTKEEMAQADVTVVEPIVEELEHATIDTSQVKYLVELLDQCDDIYVQNVQTYYFKEFGVNEWKELPANQYEKLLNNIHKKLQVRAA